MTHKDTDPKNAPRQKHHLSQVFLHDMNIIQKIVDTASILPTETVVEIGCGGGVLSEALADVAGELHIFEIDREFLEHTKARLADREHVHYHLGDVLKNTLADVPSSSFKVVANLPYHISAKLIKLLITHRAHLNQAFIMVQKEFAGKLVATPADADYTSLTVYTQHYFEIKNEFRVSASCFHPVPRVDSAVISMVPKTGVPVLDEDVFFSMINAVFWGRRKPMISALKKNPYIRFEGDLNTDPFLAEHGKARGETLTITEFYAMYASLKDRKTTIFPR